MRRQTKKARTELKTGPFMHDCFAFDARCMLLGMEEKWNYAVECLHGEDPFKDTVSVDPLILEAQSICKLHAMCYVLKSYRL